MYEKGRRKKREDREMRCSSESTSKKTRQEREWMKEKK